MPLLRRCALPAVVVAAAGLVAVLTVALPLAPPAAAATVSRWSSPATWGGTVPRAGQVVTIPAGKTVVLDVSPPKLGGLQVDGTLRFANRNLRLHTGWIMVHGRFQVGTPSAPYTARAQIILDGDPNANIMGMGANVLGVMAPGVLDLHGKRRPVRWTRLVRTAPRGTRRIVVATARGWRRGDRIVVAATGLHPSAAEERVVRSVRRRVVTLNRPLRRSHLGRVDRIGGARIPQRAEVGLLSRNIVIRGGAAAARTRIGGHIMAMKGSVARLSNVELTHMGQAGRLARYPFHFHMMGSAPGSWIRSSAIHHTFNRCVTVHGTSDVTVADNVGYHARGHCFFFEDGVEQGVKLERNLGLSTLRPAVRHRILSTDSVPATFWIQHPNNTVRGNAAAGSEGNGFWYDLPEHPTGLSATRSIRNRYAAFGLFANNVAHTNVNRSGEFRSGSGLLVEDYRPPSAAVFRGLVSYANKGFGAWVEHGGTVTGARLAGNYVGFLGRDAALRDSTVVGRTPNAAVDHWSMTGVGLYHDTASIHRVTFANFKPRQWRHGVAIGPIIEDITTVPRFSRVRFVRADRIRMTPPWVERRVAATMVTDADGTVTGTGRPRTISASHPLLVDGRCTRSSALRAHLCPTGRRITMLRVQDHSGSTARIGPTTVVRDDGARAPAPSDPSWADRPQAQTTLLMDRRYAVNLGRTTPRNFELVTAGAQAGWVQLGVRWPHGALHVYEGWGEWARTLRRASSQAELAQGGRYWVDGLGRVHVRFSADTTWRWQRIKVCAVEHCGEGLGSRTS